ncbi:MAG TPA: conjugal transfer protein TraF [Cellvibrio sp.]|nr:conjugal transfer protein TraF [Cellvibrio sp.]
MKKSLLSLALVLTSSQLMATELYNGRISGMAGAGYVTGGYSDGLLFNPSLAASYKEKDDFALVINGGGLGSDKDDLIDGLEDLVDFTDYLKNATDLDESDADRLKELMANVDERTLSASVGASVVIAIPNSFVSAALVAKATGTVGIAAYIDEDDYELIDNSVNDPFEPEDLNSSVYGSGVILRETGIALAKSFELANDNQLLIGVTPKRVKVETIVYEATVADYDEDDLDADDYTVESNASNLDAGVTYLSRKMRYGLTIQNIKSDSFRTIYDETYELDTRSTAAIGYVSEKFKAEAAMDLDAHTTFGLGGESQMLRAGVELSPLGWLQLRAGIQRDLEDTLPDAYSLGLGISPFDTVNIDIAGFSGSDEVVGGAIQIGLRL